MAFRAPKEQYLRRNGFDEQSRRFPTVSLKDGEAVEAQDVARFVIREMGSFFPSLDEMKKEVETPDTVANVSERIKRLKKEHQDNMAKLLRYYVQELYDDALDRYLQTDDIKYFDSEDFSKSTDEWAQHYASLENFYKQYAQVLASDHNDIVVRVQYDYLKELLSLYARKHELQGLAEKARAAQEAYFPQSAREYNAMTNKDAQLLVARYLMADAAKRESMRDQSQWVWRQTAPLMDLYRMNDAFRAEIERFVSENESKDPRARKG